MIINHLFPSKSSLHAGIVIVRQVAGGDMTATRRGQRKRRVLVVENFDDLRTFLAGALKEAGYHVTVAVDARQARLALAGKIDVVLLDAKLPGESGGSLADFCATRSVPAILMSGDIDCIETGDRCGYPFIAKPFKLATLMTMLDEAVATGDDAGREIAAAEA